MPANRVNPADVDAALTKGCPDATVSQLFTFSSLMMDEIRQRTGTLDTKGLVVLGWGGALFGYLLSAEIATAAWPLRVASILPALVAGYAIQKAYGAARLRDYDWPSDTDWFRIELFMKPDILRRYHLMSLLETHQNHSRQNGKKLAALQRAQKALAVASMLTAGIAALRPFLAR